MDMELILLNSEHFYGIILINLLSGLFHRNINKNGKLFLFWIEIITNWGIVKMYSFEFFIIITFTYLICIIHSDCPNHTLL